MLTKKRLMQAADAKEKADQDAADADGVTERRLK